MSSKFKITYDGGEQEVLSLTLLLAKREWSHREWDKIEMVECGMTRRMSTDLNGRPCDIERAGK